MSKMIMTKAALGLAAALVALPAAAQTMGNTAPGSNGAVANSTYKTADAKLRASKIIGASVYNDQNQKIGSVDDILMTGTAQATEPTAVISVGGFLGIGSKLVSLPASRLQVHDDRIVMPGATKDALNSMPTYRYYNS